MAAGTRAPVAPSVMLRKHGSVQGADGEWGHFRPERCPTLLFRRPPHDPPLSSLQRLSLSLHPSTSASSTTLPGREGPQHSRLRQRRRLLVDGEKKGGEPRERLQSLSDTRTALRWIRRKGASGATKGEAVWAAR